MQESLVQSLGQEAPLEKEMAMHSSILAWEIPRTEEPGLQCRWATVHGVRHQKSQTRLSDETTTNHFIGTVGTQRGHK